VGFGHMGISLLPSSPFISLLYGFWSARSSALSVDESSIGDTMGTDLDQLKTMLTTAGV
jgi:hypothetical protein